MLKRKCPIGNIRVNKRFKLHPNQRTLTQSYRRLPQISIDTSYYDIYPEISGKIKRYLNQYIMNQEGLIKISLKSMLLIGPEGCGKTHLIRSSIKAMGLQILEIGIGSLRSRHAIKKSLKEATQTYAINDSKLGIMGAVIFIDDVDIVLSPDKGFYTAISELISKTKNPIIMASTCMPSKLSKKKNIQTVQIFNPLPSLFEFGKRKQIDENTLNSILKRKENLHRIISETIFPNTYSEEERRHPEDFDYCVLALDVLIYSDYKPKKKHVVYSKASKSYFTSPLNRYLDRFIEPFDERFCVKSVEKDRLALTNIYT